MDTLKEYYDWIHRLRDALVVELEKESGHRFICDGELIEGAEKHSEAMNNRGGEPYDAPRDLWKPAVSEMVDMRVAHYQCPEEKDSAIQKEIEEMAVDLFHLEFHSFLRYFSAIMGVGVAVKETPGQVMLYATVRLTTARLKGVKIDSEESMA